jgi:hypothetical protein
MGFCRGEDESTSAIYHMHNKQKIMKHGEERKSLGHSSAHTFARRTEVLSGQWPTWIGFRPASPNSPKEGFKDSRYHNGDII